MKDVMSGADGGKAGGEAIVTRLWELFDQGRFDAVRPLLADDFVADWPQTRERIRGPENFIALNQNYPGRWRCRLLGLVVVDDERAISEVAIGDGAFTTYAISFFTLASFSPGGTRIVAAREYFADETEPPFDRSRWAEPY